MIPFARKIIQISNCVASSTDPTIGIAYSLVALCDDGSLWELQSSPDSEIEEWLELPAIPQTSAGAQKH